MGFSLGARSFGPQPRVKNLYPDWGVDAFARLYDPHSPGSG